MIVDKSLLLVIMNHVSLASEAARDGALMLAVQDLLHSSARTTIDRALTKVRDEHLVALKTINDLLNAVDPPSPPIQMRIHCPLCGTQHIDESELASKPHTSHTCQNQTCGLTWKVANVPTIGVRFLPGTNNQDSNSKETP